LRKALQRNIAENQPYWKDNLSRQDRAEHKELKSNQAVRLLPTDKNLGPALKSTDWVKTETFRHLSNELSYTLRGFLENQDRESRIKDRGSRNEDRGLRIEDRGFIIYFCLFTVMLLEKFMVSRAKRTVSLTIGKQG